MVAIQGEAAVELRASVSLEGASGSVDDGVVRFVVSRDAESIAQVTSERVTGGRATAVLALDVLRAGVYSVQATYEPGGASDSSAYGTAEAKATLTIERAQTDVRLTASRGSSGRGDRVTFSAVVASEKRGTPTGMVRFFSGEDGTQPIGTATLGGVNGQATARLTVSDLRMGEHVITARYEGDENFEPAVAPPVTHIVK
jgi:hypothetical protein